MLTVSIYKSPMFTRSYSKWNKFKESSIHLRNKASRRNLNQVKSKLKQSQLSSLDKVKSRLDKVKSRLDEVKLIVDRSDLIMEEIKLIANKTGSIMKEVLLKVDEAKAKIIQDDKDKLKKFRLNWKRWIYNRIKYIQILSWIRYLHPKYLYWIIACLIFIDELIGNEQEEWSQGNGEKVIGKALITALTWPSAFVSNKIIN